MTLHGLVASILCCRRSSGHWRLHCWRLRLTAWRAQALNESNRLLTDLAVHANAIPSRDISSPIAQFKRSSRSVHAEDDKDG